MRRLGIAIVAFFLAAAAPSTHLPEDAYGPGKSFPFTAQDDHDGAMFVWFVICDSGFRYDYIPAADFPASKRFGEVTDARSGDIAWWPTHVSIYKAETKEYLNAVGAFHLSDLKPGFPRPRYFRIKLFGGEKFVENAGTGSRVRECIPTPR